MINKAITLELGISQNKFIQTDPPIQLNQKSDELARNTPNPFKGKKFRRLRAERDITREVDRVNFDVDERGVGCTYLVKSFITRSSLSRDLVEKTLLNELNTIVKPDLLFSDILVQELDDKSWEIYLEEEEKGRIALSQSGSGLKTLLLVLVNILLVPELEKRDLKDYIFAFEEIENNLHPAMQRRLFMYLRDIALNREAYFFITTHSNVVIDLFSNDKAAQILHVIHNKVEARVNPVEVYIHSKDILDDLDIRASDLLQSNGIVWVEGPSDRLYFNRWIEIWSNGEIREGTHYQCVFYGGRLLAHLTASIQEDELNELIRILLINRNCILLMDSDKSNEEEELNDTKKRILDEFKQINAICWITKGKEVENYIPKSAIEKYYEIELNNEVGQYEEFSDYLGKKIKEPERKKFLSNKVVFAEKICPLLDHLSLKPILDLEYQLDSVLKRIKGWNGLL